MIQLIGLLLCVYLVFKGVEIKQLGRCARDEDRVTAKAVGDRALVVSILLALGFAYLFLVSGVDPRPR